VDLLKVTIGSPQYCKTLENMAFLNQVKYYFCNCFVIVVYTGNEQLTMLRLQQKSARFALVPYPGAVTGAYTHGVKFIGMSSIALHWGFGVAFF
jgi:hypothetical protein